jgi:hypothetical protein
MPCSAGHGSGHGHEHELVGGEQSVVTAAACCDVLHGAREGGEAEAHRAGTHVGPASGLVAAALAVAGDPSEAEKKGAVMHGASGAPRFHLRPPVDGEDGDGALRHAGGLDRGRWPRQRLERSGDGARWPDLRRGRGDGAR